MSLKEKLLRKRANYATSLSHAEHRIVQARENLRAAREEMLAAKELRAGLQTGLQVVDETLADLTEASPAPAAAAQPSTP